MWKTGITRRVARNPDATGDARVAQEVDNAGDQDGDDPADAKAIRAGYNLAAVSGDVTRARVINILRNHPGWVGRI